VNLFSLSRDGFTVAEIRTPLLLLVLATLVGCASVPNKPARAAQSSYGCIKAVVQDKVPTGIPDSRAHCLAAGLIARYCSRTEAYMAGAGKEFRDMLGFGDPEWSDWRADRVGMDCARQASDDAALATCCAERGY